MYVHCREREGTERPRLLTVEECKTALLLLAEALDDQRALLILRDYETERGAETGAELTGYWPCRCIIDQCCFYRAAGRRAYAACVRLATDHARLLRHRRLHSGGRPGWVASAEGRFVRDMREWHGLGRRHVRSEADGLPDWEDWGGAVCRIGHVRRLVWAGLSGAAVPADVQGGLAGLKQAMQRAIRGEAGWVEGGV